MPGYTLDKNGRARDERGRFLSERERRAIYYAETGQITSERVNGHTFYRGPDGRRVAAKFAALQTEERTIIGHGKWRREVHPEKLRSQVTEKPGRQKGIAKDLHFNSAAKLVGDIAATGGDQWVKWKGKYYKVTPEQAGYLQDAFRAMQARYIELFSPFTESPQLSIPFIETTVGDIYDIDKIETMDEELADEFAGNEQAERAQDEFNAFVAKIADMSTQKRSRNAKKTKSAKGDVKSKKRARPRGTNSKGRSKRGRR